jgi:GNAT superfamily N-acetyltransferase
MIHDQQPKKIRTWDEWMPGMKLDMPLEEFRKLPRNAAYKYEYLDGHALLSPRPKHFHGILALADFTQPRTENLDGAIGIRPMESHDQEDYPALFAAAFHGVQPFGGLADEERQEAARQSLAKTVEGQDGPLLESASFTAIHRDAQQPVGGILITRVLGGDPSEHNSYGWSEAVPLGEKGQPHLTWIFVAPVLKGRGVGTALLAAAVRALEKLGYRELWSTFLLGNDSSMLWHWRNGFRLPPSEFSKRITC